MWDQYDTTNNEHGLIDTKDMAGLGRMNHILTAINSKIYNKIQEENEYSLIVMEDFSFASKGASLFQIAGLAYIVRYDLWQKHIPSLLVPPTVLKKFVTGQGNSDKNVMLKEIYKRWSVDLNDDNVGDAYGLTRIGRALLGKDSDLTAFQLDAMKKLPEVDWP